MTVAISYHKDPRVCACAKEVLGGFTDVCRSLHYATFLTDDGFEVGSIGGDERQNRRVASMASSMQALGDAVAKDLRMGGAEYIILAAERGYVIQMRVPDHAMVLAAHFDFAETVGKALSGTRLVASKLGAMILAQAA